MKKLATALFVLFTVSVNAQTLFYYGKDSVSVDTFLKAWQKNNTGKKTEKELRSYLQLFINSRLKIREALELGYDTLPHIIADLNNLRQQILPSYLEDPETTSRLVREAFERSQKDIHLAHIFIGNTKPSMQGATDPAFKTRAAQAYAELEKGKSFEEVARKYSADPGAGENGGDMGWITVFSLPYELENLAYTTPSGQYSQVYQSKAGYHIFKNLGERKASGRMKAAQILLAFPPDADEKARDEIRKRADSIYRQLNQGQDFAALAQEFSNDVISAAANGQMQEFGIGQYDPVFEEQVFSLKSDGSLSRPFLTSHGYHIVKRISRQVPGAKMNDDEEQKILNRVMQSDRMAIVKKEMLKKQIAHVPLARMPVDQRMLWAFSDSLLNFMKPSAPITISNSTILVKLGEKNVTAADWISYAQAFRYKTDGSGLKTYPQLFEEFMEALAMDYYQNHLELYNPGFANQLQEFKEGNLFFEIMQDKVWGPAQTDTAALRKYFSSNQNAYHWKPSAEAVMFYATDEATAKTFRNQLVKSPVSWRTLASQFSENMAADSARIEISQIPNPTRIKLKAGSITSLQVSDIDGSASFAMIFQLHRTTEPRSFDEARGMVINDYQAALEKQWIEELKKKYPVKVNEKVYEEMVRREL